MKTTIDETKISLWILLFYTYLIWLRAIVLPPENIITPGLLLISLLLVLIGSGWKLHIGKSLLQTQSIAWILILVLICIDNQDLIANLVNRGIIQYFVMIVFMLSCANNATWTEKWIIWTKIYALIHACATIFFYYFKNSYPLFANMAFSGVELQNVLRQFSYGWMPGICKNVSANGMILSICLIVYAVSAMSKQKRSRIELISIIVISFALVLTCKRGPLLFVLISLSVVYLVNRRNKEAFVRILKLFAFILIFILAVIVLSNYVPAIKNFILKSEELSNSNKGIFNGRQGLWNLAIDMFKSSPLLGKGFGCFSEYAELYDAISNSAHNFYLQVLAELGLIGIFLYGIAFISGVCINIKYIKIVQNEKDRTILSVALGVEMFTILYGLTSTSLMYYYILVPFFLACSASRAVVFQYERKSQSENADIILMENRIVRY